MKYDLRLRGIVLGAGDGEVLLELPVDAVPFSPQMLRALKEFSHDLAVDLRLNGNALEDALTRAVFTECRLQALRDCILP